MATQHQSTPVVHIHLPGKQQCLLSIPFGVLHLRLVSVFACILLLYLLWYLLYRSRHLQTALQSVWFLQGQGRVVVVVVDT